MTEPSKKAELPKAGLLAPQSQANKFKIAFAANLLCVATIGGAITFLIVSSVMRDPVKLHAIPDAEVPSTSMVPRNSSLFSDQVTELHGNEAVHGSPDQRPVTEAEDFTPSNQPVDEPADHSTVDDSDDVAVVVSPDANTVTANTVAANTTASVAPHTRNASHTNHAAAPERWANLSSEVRVGALLLGASGAWGAQQRYFNGAAVLLLHMCGCHSVLGVILNMPTRDTMSRAFCPRTRNMYSAFLDNTIYMGGPVGPHWITLHGHAVRGATPLLPGVYSGGDLRDAHAQVVSGAASADDTWFMHGYAAWPLARLQAEADAGQWTVVQAPARRLLQLAKNASRDAFVSAVRAAAHA